MSSGRIPSAIERPSNRSSPGLRRDRGVGDAQAVLAEARPERAVLAGELGDDEVHRRRADELRDEQIARPLVEHLWRVHLLQQAVPHHRAAIAHRHRLDLIVRDVDGRHSEVPLDSRDLRTHLDAKLRVEVRERLVHEKRLRVPDDRAPHGDPLALAARECSWLLLQRVRETEDACCLANATIDLVLGDALHLEREAHVPRRGHVRIQRVVLEDHGDVTVLRREIVHDLTVDPHVPGRDRLEAGDHSQRRRLAAAGRTDEDDELTRPDLEIEIDDGLRAVGIDLRQTLEGDFGHVNLRGQIY